MGNKTGDLNCQGGHSPTTHCLLHTPAQLPRCPLRCAHPADLGERGPPGLGALPVAGCQLGVLWSNFGLSPGLGAWTAPGKDHRSFSEHLLRARHWAGSCPGIVSFNSSYKSCEVGAINNPILQMKKWRLRDEVTSFIHLLITYGVPTLHKDRVDKQ